MTRRRKRKAAPPSAVPWRCVVLAVDTARLSGWAIRTLNQQSEFGEADTTDHDSLCHIVRFAAQRARWRRVPLVLVLERPWGGERHTVTGLERAAERWMVAWRASGESALRVVRVYPPTWRSPVLGGRWVSAKREIVRPEELRIAQALLRAEHQDPDALTNDEAAAVLIGVWASRAAAVGKVIGKRARDVSVAGLRACWCGHEPPCPSDCPASPPLDPYAPDRARLLPQRERQLQLAEVIPFPRRHA